GPATFLFATLAGTIAGWNGASGTSAQTMAIGAPGTEYSGLAMGNNGGANFLYAAKADGIDVYNGAFASISPSGGFVDPTLPAGFTAYHVAHIRGALFVSYENETSGGGIINRFDLNGTFLGRFTTNPDGGPLESPWGMV